MSDNIVDDHNKFKEMDLNISEIEEINYNSTDKTNTKSRFFKIKARVKKKCSGASHCSSAAPEGFF